MLEEPEKIECPYCGAVLSIVPDIFGGKKQIFVEECDTCDKPIRFELELEGDEVVRFEAFQENE